MCQFDGAEGEPAWWAKAACELADKAIRRPGGEVKFTDGEISVAETPAEGPAEGACRAGLQSGPAERACRGGLQRGGLQKGW